MQRAELQEWLLATQRELDMMQLRNEEGQRQVEDAQLGEEAEVLQEQQLHDESKSYRILDGPVNSPSK